MFKSHYHKRENGKSKKILVSVKGLPFRSSPFILCKKTTEGSLFSWFFWLFSTRTSRGLRSGVSTTSQLTLGFIGGFNAYGQRCGTSAKSSLETRPKRLLTYGRMKLTLDTLANLVRKIYKDEPVSSFQTSREAKEYQEPLPSAGLTFAAHTYKGIFGTVP